MFEIGEKKYIFFISLLYFYLWKMKKIIILFSFLSFIGFGLSISNPASVFCSEKWWKLEIQKRGDGWEYGVCYFEDNRQCEEWAMFKWNCPIGGIKVTWYVTPAAKYCGLIGGEYKTTWSLVYPEQWTCKLPNWKTVDVWHLYNWFVDNSGEKAFSQKWILEEISTKNKKLIDKFFEAIQNKYSEKLKTPQNNVYKNLYKTVDQIAKKYAIKSTANANKIFTSFVYLKYLLGGTFDISKVDLEWKK